MIQRVAIENHTFDAVPDIQVTLISDVLNLRTSCCGLLPDCRSFAKNLNARIMQVKRSLDHGPAVTVYLTLAGHGVLVKIRGTVTPTRNRPITTTSTKTRSCRSAN